MVTVILPVEIVKELGNVLSSFLIEDGGDNLIDDIYYLVKPVLTSKDMSDEELVQIKPIISSNILDTLTLICLDKVIDSLGEKGFASTLESSLTGFFNVNFICRTSHIETLLGGDLSDLVMKRFPRYDFVSDMVVNSVVHYELYNELSNFLESRINMEKNKYNYMFSIVSTITNLQGYLDFNIRDVINTTIVDSSNLVMFLRGNLDDEDKQHLRT